MRFSFIMGGLVGAALTVYFTRNQNTPLHQKVNQVGEKVKSTMDTAGFLMKEVVFAGQGASDERYEDNEDDFAGDFSQIEQLAEQDPDAKKEMDKILKDTH